MSKGLLYLLCILSVVYLIIMFGIVYRIKLKEQKRETLFLGKLHLYKSKIIILYEFLWKIPFVKYYMENISRRYEIYCPGNKKANALRTMIVTALVWSLCGLEFFFVFLRKPTLLNGIISLILIVIISNEVLFIAMRNTEIKLLHQMVDFFADVRHFYYDSRMVHLAILDSIKKTGKEMKAHGTKLYEVLTSENTEKEIRIYNETVKNNYLKLFLSTSIQVIDNGDKEINNQSVFLMNLHHLKNEVQIEELKQKKLVFLFSGLIFITVAPILSLSPCKEFGISNLPELIDFYEGTIGIAILILSIIIILLCYIFQNYEREIRGTIPKSSYLLQKISNNKVFKLIINNYTERYYTKILRLKKRLKEAGEVISYGQFLIKQMIFALITFILAIGICTYIHNVRKSNIANQVMFQKYENMLSTSFHIEEMKELVRYYVNIYKNKAPVIESSLRNLLLDEITLKQDKEKIIVIDEIIDRLTAYQKEYLYWYELLFALLLSFGAFYIPYLFLLYKGRLIRQGMDEEVIQFQSIIFMLMYLDNISIPSILETIEVYAVIFKSSIQECMNDFGSGSENALMVLREKESFEPFKRLVDNLIISDRIGIIKAFDEIAADRVYFQEKRKQDNEILLKKKSDRATLIAYIPMVFIMITYLITPFVIQCVRDYQMITMELY